MHAAVVTSFDTPPRYRAPGPGRPRAGRGGGRRPRRRAAPPGALAGRRLALHEHRRAAAGPGHRRRGARRRRASCATSSWTTRRWARWPSGRSSTSTAVSCSPPDVDPVPMAAAMNPAMSSWVALRRRIDFERGSGCSCSGRPAMRAGWPSRSPSASAPGR